MAITPRRPKRSHRDESAPAGQLFARQLSIGGASPNSLHAHTNIQKICDQQLPGRCQLEAVDIYQPPECATVDQMVAVPMRLERLPPPLQRWFGPLSDSRQVLSASGQPASSVNPAGDPANEG